MASKEYSCVKKTKKAFETSLVNLSKEYPLKKITVKMICENAQLSRNAFYFHYEDINALIKNAEDSIVQQAEERIDSLKSIGFPRNVYATVEGLIDLLYENRDVCMMLLDKTYSTSFVKRMSDPFCSFNYEYFVTYHGDSKRTRFDFFYTFISNGFYGLLRHWFDNPSEMTKAEITALAYIFIKRLIVFDDPDLDSVIPGKGN